MFVGRQWSRGSRLPPPEGLRLVSGQNGADTESPKNIHDAGRPLAYGIIAVCAALLSLAAILLCVRFRAVTQRIKFSSLRRNRLSTPSSSSSSKRRHRTEDYEDAMSCADPPHPLPPTLPRLPRLHDYQYAKRCSDDRHAPPPGRSKATGHPRPYEYEDVSPGLGSLYASRDVVGRPKEYEDALMTSPTTPTSTTSTRTVHFPRGHRTDSAGYTEIVIQQEEEEEEEEGEEESGGVRSPEPKSSEYSRLGVEHVQRALSEPGARRKAYDHVRVGPARSRSAGMKPSVSVTARVTAKGVTSEGHHYDVSVVAVANPPRVEVIDGVYDKLRKAAL